MTTAIRPRLADELADLGITYRQLDYWVRQGYLKPRGGHPGTGFSRAFSDEERRIAVAMARCVRAGFTPVAAARVARAACRAAGDLAGTVQVKLPQDLLLEVTFT